MPDERGAPAYSSAQNGHQECSQNTAPEEWISAMDNAIHLFIHHGAATETLTRQFPKCSPGFFLFCEVTNENAAAHILSFTHSGSAHGQKSKSLSSSLDDTYQQNNNGYNQQDVNKTSYGVTTHQPQRPQNEQYHSNCP
jgi:hypothetical protein